MKTIFKLSALAIFALMAFTVAAATDIVPNPGAPGNLGQATNPFPAGYIGNVVSTNVSAQSITGAATNQFDASGAAAAVGTTSPVNMTNAANAFTGKIVDTSGSVVTNGNYVGAALSITNPAANRIVQIYPQFIWMSIINSSAAAFLSVNNGGTNYDGRLHLIGDTGGDVFLKASDGSGTFSGTVTASNFVGNGAGLTNVTAANLSGNIGANQVTNLAAFVTNSLQNSRQTNTTLVSTDGLTSNQVPVFGSLHSSEVSILANPNEKPEIAFASCLNKAQTNVLRILILGDSMSGYYTYNSISKNLIEMLNYTYGWAGDYCLRVDQNGTSVDSNPHFTNFWTFQGGACLESNGLYSTSTVTNSQFVTVSNTSALFINEQAYWVNAGTAYNYTSISNIIGTNVYLQSQYNSSFAASNGALIVFGDQGASGISWSQGQNQGGITAIQDWPANQYSIIALTQPTGGNVSIAGGEYGARYTIDSAPNHFTGINNFSTYSVGTNIIFTNFPCPVNYEPKTYCTEVELPYYVTGTNVILGSGFSNTNATGIATYWFGDNNSLACGHGGSMTLQDWCNTPTNIMHMFASVAQPDVIIYHAKDYNDSGSTNINQMTNSLSILLGKTGLAWTNTKVFLISTPASSENDSTWPPSSTTTNNTALRLACEANNWTYIPLNEEWNGQLMGAGSLGADPISPTGVGIIADGTHPSDWGAFSMAYWILTKQFNAPLKYDPNFFNSRISYNYYPPQFCAQYGWGVPSVTPQAQSMASADVLPWMIATGDTNPADILPLNLLCQRLRSAGLWPDGATNRLAFWPFAGGTERTARFNLIAPAGNYMGFGSSTVIANGAVSNYWVVATNGIRNGTAYTALPFYTGLFTGVRESTTATGGYGQAISPINHNIAISPTNSGEFLAFYRNGSIPSTEGYWACNGTTLNDNLRYLGGGNLQMWWADGSAQTIAGTPTAGVLGRIDVNGVETLWLNQTNLASYTNGAVANRTTDCVLMEGVATVMSTNATVWAAGYCGGYTSLQFSNLQYIVSLYGIDKTNYSALSYP